MEKSSENCKGLRVVVVGGAVGGLILTNCLEKIGSDYVILERRADVAPQVGASIAILANGGRILDQLGMFNDVLEMTEPLITNSIWSGTGQELSNSDRPKLIQMRTGYGLAFLDRQKLLQVLYRHLRDKSTIKTSKRVSRIEHKDTEVVVHCDDGSFYSGDIVVGADGIHSTVREEMQKYMKARGPKGITEKDENCISAEYSAVFGISSHNPGIVPGHGNRTYAKDFSTITIASNDRRIYWLFFTKLDKRYHGDEIPRFRNEDADSHLRAYFDMPMNDKVTLKDLWDTRLSYSYVPLEEAKFDNWTYNRFVCLGDSIHKMTPNMGAGGNCAIESAAALSNALNKLMKTTGGQKPSTDSIKIALAEFYEGRKRRADFVVDAANELSRVEGMARAKHALTVKLMPMLGDWLVDNACEMTVGAAALDFLPLPPRSLEATMPYNSEAGIGKHQSLLQRALVAFPLLLFYYVATITLGPTGKTIAPLAVNAGRLGLFLTLDGSTISIESEFYGIEAVDFMTKLYVIFFLPLITWLSEEGTLQSITFLIDIFPLHVIWIVESLRRGNKFIFAKLPLIFALAYQYKGIGRFAPIYFFLHYIQCPPTKYAASDNRLTQMSYIKTILPATLLGLVLPTVTMSLPNLSISTRQHINAYWQLFPLWVSLLHRLFATAFVTDTTMRDRISNPTADMPYLRLAYGTSALVAAIAYHYAWVVGPSNPAAMIAHYTRHLSLLGGPAPGDMSLSLTLAMAHFFVWDQLCAFGAGMLWVALHFYDLKRVGKLRAGWVRVLGTLGAATAVVGPGAAMAGMWWWREEVLAERKVFGNGNGNGNGGGKV